MRDETVRLRLIDVSKRFGAVTALDRVTLACRAGEVHALLGENGAGKTTLMNVLYGLARPDRGSIEVDGRKVAPRTPLEARRLGIGMVHQHFTVVDRLTTVENLALSFSAPGLRLRSERVAERATAMARRIGLDLGDLHVRAETLTVGARQRIEILKALAGDARVLILDEPTAVLTPQEVQQLFIVLRRLRDEGCAVIFISHKLREVREIADTVTVLRRGKVVGTGTPSTLSDDDLALLMIGSPLVQTRRVPRTSTVRRDAPEKNLLRLSGVQLSPVASERGCELRVPAGEVMGIVGVDGNGQKELFEILAGLQAPRRGEVYVNGRAIEHFSPAAMLAAGIGIIPPDRRADGLVAAMTVAENLVLSRALLDRFSRCGLLRAAEIRLFCREQAQRFHLRASSLDQPAKMLSGGNQQRLIVARALAGAPEVLLAVNPTRGLDVAASRAVFDAIEDFVAGGRAALLISTDLDEVLESSDRVAVLFRHALSAPLSRPFPVDHVGRMMAGAEWNA